MRKHSHQAADLRAEWMMLPIASPVEPQDLACRAGRRQRVQHRENRRRSDSRAQQQRALAGQENETAARHADIESIAHSYTVPQISSSRPVRLDLHADSIALSRDGTRKRVASKEWRAASGPLKPQDYVLTSKRRP